MAVFKTKFFGGYDPRDVLEQFNQIEKELNEVKERNRKLESQLEDKDQAYVDLKEKYDQVEHNHRMLVESNQLTEKANEEIARLALKEASGLIEKAKGNANLILKDSMDYVKGMHGEIEEFKSEAKAFRAQIVKMSEDLLQTIDNSEIFSLINEEENTKIETGHNEDL